jgi:hypothetical protein
MNREWIDQLHVLEKKMLEIIKLQAKCVELLNAPPTEPNEFEQHCVLISELVSDIHTNFERIKREVDDAGIAVTYVLPNTQSIAADLKRAELIQDTTRLLLDIL